MNGAAPLKKDEEEVRGLDPNVRQRRASDPEGSAWVGASAGTGKTKVLTDRVLRLLLPRADGRPGSSPQRILCLTFTKAAASEMALRIGKVLSEWAVMPDDALADSLKKLTGREPAAMEIAAARRLFAATVDTPGGLKIMTIHSFCQSVLSRFPLEAGLSPQFSILEEEGAASPLLTRARDSVIASHPAMQRLAAVLNEEQFMKELNSLTRERAQLQGLIARAGSVRALYERICERLDVTPDLRPEDILRAACMEANDNIMLRCCRALAQGAKTDAGRGLQLQLWIEKDIDGRVAAFSEYTSVFLTQKGEPLKRMATAGTANADADCETLLRREAMRLVEAQEKIKAAQCAAMTHDLIEIGAAIIDAYQAMKERGGKLDFDDLIIRTLALFERTDIAPWVLFKLDGGLDHILIDEAQDTNPEQWRIIATLCEEFFAGRGVRDDIVRTLFTVGDMKQSIFSFQRAAPEEFDRMRTHFSAKIVAAAQQFTDEALDISFRTVAAVLKLVDETFAPDAMRAGLGPDVGQHHSFRRGQAGIAELWPVFEADGGDDGAAPEGWSAPVSVADSRSGATRLAEHIGETIKNWIENEEFLPSRNRAVKAGDIMILVRTRTAFVGQLVRALKTRNIPVSGVDRMVLGEQLAVMDLIAAADFALLPENDLALACLLKSPLLGWSEEQLYAACIDRPGPLWRRVQEQADAGAVKWLRGLIESAASDHPYEFFARLLQRPCPGNAQSGMRALLARLGSEAADPLEELLSATLAYERANIPTLQGFISWQKNEDITIKRELEEAGQAVRIMTVHGSKGLQAPIVFMPDTLRGPSSRKLDRLLWPEKTKLDVPLWSPRADTDCELFTAARQAAGVALDEEYRRLLYVAMTRAEDRLYIAGHQGKKAPLPDSWYYAIKAAFERLPETQQIPFGESVALRLEGKQEKDADKADGAKEQAAAIETALPGWASRAAPAEPSPPQPLAPSRPSEPEPAIRSPLAGGDVSRFKRGNLTHKLLQILPNLPESRREAAALAYLSQPGHGIGEEIAQDIARETFAVIQHADFAPLFGPGSIAEVPLTGLVKGQLVSGQVDRLLITPDTIWIIDYKTNRPPPRDPNAVPDVYIKQMQAYRDTLSSIYPGRKIRTFLLWTDGPFLMEIT
jgi:ATP-dependent helicase/nuclease subunit A